MPDEESSPGALPNQDRSFSDPKFPNSQCWRFAELETTKSGKIAVKYRILHPEGQDYQGAKLTVKYEQVTTVKGSEGKRLASGTVPATQTLMEPWVFAAEFEVLGGQSKLKIQVQRAGANVVLPEGEPDAIELGSPVTGKKGKQQVTIARQPPRLSADINQAGRALYRGSASTDVEKIVAILSWVNQGLFQNIRGPWLGPNTGRGVHVDQSGLTGDALYEEKWACRLSTMMLLAPYIGPGTAYAKAEPTIFRSMDVRTGRRAPPGPAAPAKEQREYPTGPAAHGESFYPIAVMCQQLCTVGLLTRGLNVADHMGTIGINAQGNKKWGAFSSKRGGSWYEDDKDHKYREAKTAAAGTPSPAQPGSIYEFARIRTTPDELSSSNLTGDHVGMVLRSYARDGGWAIQTLDTAGLNAPGRDKGVKPPLSGVFDDPWVQNVVGPIGPPVEFRGLGTPGPQFQPTSGGLGTLDMWWPLGFCRLVISRRGAKKEVVYHTPAIRMHPTQDGWAVDFPPAILAWALRNMPFNDEFEATWEVLTPREELAVQTMRDARTSTVPQIVEACAAAESAATAAGAAAPPTKVPCPKKPHNNVYHLVDLTALATTAPDLPGTNRVSSKKVGVDDNRPWGVAGGVFSDKIAASEVPDHLRGSDHGCALQCTACPFGYKT